MSLDWLSAVVRKDWQSKPIGAVVVVNSGSAEGACEILPRRVPTAGGASVVRRDAAMSRTEDLNVKISEEALTCNGTINCGCCKAVAADEGS